MFIYEQDVEANNIKGLGRVAQLAHLLCCKKKLRGYNITYGKIHRNQNEPDTAFFVGVRVVGVVIQGYDVMGNGN